MLDLLAHVRADTARFVDAARSGDLAAPVPACPDWTLADLTGHLAQVQRFWAAIVTGEIGGPADLDGPPAAPPADEAIDLLVANGELLVAALDGADPATPCWTWAADQSVGFVLRRQAHEALVHRVDAEQTVGAVSGVDPELAADGVAEFLDVMVGVDGGPPPWGAVTPSGTSLRIEATDVGRTWDVGLGRFEGTDPDTGTSVRSAVVIEESGGAEPASVLRATAADLDLWLWRRLPADAVTVDGDHDAAERLREAID